ncbi:MAG: WbqC-like protein family protein [Firmicutes bacterium ADurb.Bin182]|nr:MAG: WbqC-like protein family protein [Firmicutes bacterium ADurb.Bin182]
MVVSVHQPNYIPWLGYFYKIHKSDLFVILDDVQFIKRGFINRNRIKTPQGISWLTVPVENKGSYGRNIKEIRIADEGWEEKHLRTVELNYKKADHFRDFFDVFRECIMKGHGYLSELNIDVIKAICKFLNIKTGIVLSSELDIKETSTERIIRICETVGADRYLSGKGGIKYQDEKKFEEHSIELMYSDFNERPHQQLWGDYTAGLSVIDYIFNCGPQIENAWDG